MVGEVICDLELPMHMAKIIDIGIKKNQMSVIYEHGIYMLLIAIAGSIGGFLSALFGSISSRKFGNSLRKATFKKALNFSWEQTDKVTTGSLITRITNDVMTLQMLVSMSVRMFVRTIMLFCGGIGYMVRINPKFGLILLIVLPIEILVIFIFLRKVNPMFVQVQESLDSVNEVMQENVNGSRVVKTFTNEEKESNRFDRVSKNLSNKSIRVSKLLAYMSPFQILFLNITVISILYIGGNEVLAGTGMQIGEVSASLTYITQILNAVMSMGHLFQTVARGIASGRRIQDILNTEPTIVSGGTSLDILGNVEFKDVCFKYRTSSNDILTNINFEVKQGESLAILGATGSGKTTIVNLIPRFYDCYSGSVLVDGVDVKEYDLKSLRQSISLVLQKSELFTGSIFDNIRWGKPDATLEEVREACRIAQADDFIMSFNDGYDTIIGEKGSSLSGGQKQRVCIARAILKKPKILIFDDATSALDLNTEARLYKALKEYMSDVTIILIAQRVASAKGAEKIMVIDDGEIKGIGTNDELLKTNEVYQDIYYSQLKANGGEDDE
ncbi:MAG: ABC transporter ATP-binding protein [Bacilli bacterium]|nr:ABC transporter ATP-binding protein [Bacilli bacterium]